MSFQLKPLEEEDFAVSAALVANAFGIDRQGLMESFPHWWRDNPAWDSHVSRGWVAQSDEGEMVGFLANIPLPYIVSGMQTRCCAASSIATHPRWRGHGIARALGQAFLAQGTGKLLIGTESTPTAYRLWRSLGMSAMERPWQQTAYRVIADGRAWLESRAGRIAGIGAGVIQHSLAALSRPSRALRPEKIERFLTSDATGLERCKASECDTYPSRNVDTANWMFFGSARMRQSRVVFAARAGAELVGYLSMKRKGAIAYYLLECRTRDADPEIAIALLMAARAYAQQQRIAYLIVRPYTQLIADALPRALAWKFSQPPVTFCYDKNGVSLDTSRWETSPVDGDVSVN